MKHLLPLLILLTACASTKEAPQKPKRGTLPDWEDKAPQAPPTNYDSVRNMYRHHQQTTSNVIRF